MSYAHFVAMWGIFAAVLGGAVVLAALESATGEWLVPMPSAQPYSYLIFRNNVDAVGQRTLLCAHCDSATADLLRGQGRTEAPRRTELLERQQPDGEQKGSAAAGSGSAKQHQQQRRGFTTAVRGFAAGAVRSTPRAI